MRRAEIYRVHKPTEDPKTFRCFVVVSRQTVIDSGFSSVICAPILTSGLGYSTQVPVGIGEGMKHESWILCDNLVSIRKEKLTQFVGSLPPPKIAELDRALKIALDLR
jgi:mRNA interferase MazF